MRSSWLRHLRGLALRMVPARSYGLQQTFLLAVFCVVVGLVLGLLLLVENRQRASIVLQMQKRGIAIRGPDAKQETVGSDAVSQHVASTRRPLEQRVQPTARVAEYYDLAVPAHSQGDAKTWGPEHVELSLGDMWTETQRRRHHVLLLGILGVLVGSVVATWLARRITALMRTLTAGSIAVAHGNGRQVSAVSASDAMAVLTAHCNHITSELLKHRRALEQTNRQLDHKVRELSLLANYNENILTSMTSGLLTLDHAGCFETCNTLAEAILGRPLVELRGQPYQRALADNFQFVHVIEASRYHGMPLRVPRLEFHRGDGSSVPLALRTAMLRDHDGRRVGLLAVFEDLSPIHTLERQLHRADRLASLGQMAACIAHEIRNPLTSIRTFAQLVSRKHDDPSFVEKFDRVVLRELDRINVIVEELLELARPARLHYGPVAISPILQQVIDVYGERIQQQGITLKTRFATIVPPLLADAEQLYRSFANIVLNAIEAMLTGGELQITCRPVPKAFVEFAVSDHSSSLAAAPTETSATLDVYASDMEVVISDSGEGIPTEQLDMVFTPFHTTKPKGTGLGLALAHKIIEEHHGDIHIASRVGQGTVVTVTLPTALSHCFSAAHIS